MTAEDAGKTHVVSVGKWSESFEKDLEGKTG